MRARHAHPTEGVSESWVSRNIKHEEASPPGEESGKRRDRDQLKSECAAHSLSPATQSHYQVTLPTAQRLNKPHPSLLWALGELPWSRACQPQAQASSFPKSWEPTPYCTTPKGLIPTSPPPPL